MKTPAAAILGLCIVVAAFIVQPSNSRAGSAASSVGPIPGLRVADIPIERAFSTVLPYGPGAPTRISQPFNV